MLEADKLIFLISAPRSGSTLAQHILASHSQVYTAPEPWFLLNLAYHRRHDDQRTAEYNDRYAGQAVDDLLRSNPLAERAYLEGVRNLVRQTYGALHNPENKTHFLDKTTRYYLILPYLFSLFPEAKYVFLLRNPLAIASSILSYNFAGHIAGLQRIDRQRDLHIAPRAIRDAAESAKVKKAVVHYEDLVRSPERSVQLICESLELEYEPQMLTYGGKVDFGGKRVDTKSIHRHQTAVGDYAHTWHHAITTKTQLRFFRDYLDTLPDDCVSGPEYSRDDLSAALDSLKRRVVNDWQVRLRSQVTSVLHSTRTHQVAKYCYNSIRSLGGRKAD